MSLEQEARARAYYASRVRDRLAASHEFAATKVWECYLMPWRPILRFMKLNRCGLLELAAFEAGVKTFGALNWLRIIETPEPPRRPDHLKVVK